MTTQDIHPSIDCRSMPARNSQKKGFLHLATLYMLKRARHWSPHARQFRMGTTRVRGREKEERMEVTVERQMEWHAPPEHTLMGMDRAEKTFRSKCYTREGYCESLRLSISRQSMWTRMASGSSIMDFLCRTSHFPSSLPPCMPPSFLTTWHMQRTNAMRTTQVTTILVRCSPREWVA